MYSTARNEPNMYQPFVAWFLWLLATWQDITCAVSRAARSAWCHMYGNVLSHECIDLFDGEHTALFDYCSLYGVIRTGLARLWPKPVIYDGVHVRRVVDGDATLLVIGEGAVPSHRRPRLMAILTDEDGNEADVSTLCNRTLLLQRLTLAQLLEVLRILQLVPRVYKRTSSAHLYMLRLDTGDEIVCQEQEHVSLPGR